jgi:Putative metallopeptidase
MTKTSAKWAFLVQIAFTGTDTRHPTGFIAAVIRDMVRATTRDVAMFTKTLSALAIILSTVSGAVALTKHEGTAANHEPAIKASRQNPRDTADFVVGNMLFVGFHEMGHALTDQFHLPTLGRAEDAADSFATIAFLDVGSEFSINVLVQAARGLFLSDRRDRKQREELDFSEAHGLDKRAYQIICLMVGSDQEQFKELADWVRMPRDRQRGCANDYEDAKHAWHSRLRFGSARSAAFTASRLRAPTSALCFDSGMLRLLMLLVDCGFVVG